MVEREAVMFSVLLRRGCFRIPIMDIKRRHSHDQYADRNEE